MNTTVSSVLAGAKSVVGGVLSFGYGVYDAGWGHAFSRDLDLGLILAGLAVFAMGTSIAVGTSSKHAISHLKVLIVDGLYVVTGSTNWSLGGEEKQDNELAVMRSAVVAAAFRTKLDIDHDFMLAAMKGTVKQEPLT